MDGNNNQEQKNILICRDKSDVEDLEKKRRHDSPQFWPSIIFVMKVVASLEKKNHYFVISECKYEKEKPFAKNCKIIDCSKETIKQVSRLTYRRKVRLKVNHNPKQFTLCLEKIPKTHNKMHREKESPTTFGPLENNYASSLTRTNNPNNSSP